MANVKKPKSAKKPRGNAKISSADAKRKPRKKSVPSTTSH